MNPWRKILPLCFLLSLVPVSELAPQSLGDAEAYNVFRDEESTFVRYWNKAFIQAGNGWGLVFLNTEDFWNFFGMMDVNDIIYGASWLVHKTPPLFVSFDDKYDSASVYRFSLAYDFRNLLGFLTLQPGVSLKFAGQSISPGTFAAHPEYAQYLRYPKRKLGLDFFLQYYVDTAVLKSKVFYLMESVDNPLKNLYGDLMVRVGSLVALGPVAEFRRGAEGVGSFIEALQAGVALELPPWFKLEARHRAFRKTTESGGISGELWSKVFKDPLDWQAKGELTLPFALYGALHWQARYGYGFEAGLDVGSYLMGDNKEAMTWKVALGYNKISEDPLLQTPGQWSFVFSYFGDADKF